MNKKFVYQVGNNKNVTEVEWPVVDWMHLSENQEEWWAFVNTVMKLWIPEETVHFLTNRASKERLCLVELMSAVNIHVESVWVMSCFIGFPILCT
jgi:hypothetical protein